jgi:hypothetical protein
MTHDHGATARRDTGKAKRSVRRRFAFAKRPIVGPRTRLAAVGTTLIVAAALASSACAASTTTSDSPAKAKQPAAASAPKPKTAAVPHLLGLSRADASAALHRVGLTIGAITRQPSSQPAGTVLRQGTSAGSSLDAGTSVAVIVASPLPRVPDVVGDVKATAVSQVRAAGFSVQISTRKTTSGEDNVVLSQSPAGGKRVKPGEVIELVVSDLHKPVTLSSAGSSSCTPGYSPCLPPASDYDCEGGSGDGPKYTGYVEVTGSDPYDLDNDGDGVACES